MSRESSPIWKLFKIKDTKMKCTICKKTMKIGKSNANVHLMRHHKEREEIEKFKFKWKTDTYLLWEHFSRKDPFDALCNLCDKSLKNANRHNIESHLNHCHKNAITEIKEEITSNISIWLSQHFLFEDSFATCKLQGCKYSVRIFEGINVLKTHLAKRHNINECPECEGRTGDNNADGMIQQSVDEKKYVDPSSHHDNTHLQSPKNQESQQGPVTSISMPTDYVMAPPKGRQSHEPFDTSFLSFGPAIEDIGAPYEPVTSISMPTDYVMAPPEGRQSHEPFNTSFLSFGPAIENIGASYESNYSGQQGS